MTVLKDELEMNMRLIGARTLADLDESMVDTRALSTHIGMLDCEILSNCSSCPLR
jgi:L-lactate dehydrogenase (cytochrome)